MKFSNQVLATRSSIKLWLQHRQGTLAILLSSVLALSAISCSSREDSPADRLLSSNRLLATLPESTAAFYHLSLSDEGFKRFRQSEWGQAVGEAVSRAAASGLDTVTDKISSLLFFAWVDQSSADIGLGAIAEVGGSVGGSVKGTALDMLQGFSSGVPKGDLQFEQSDGRSLVRLMLRDGAGPEVWVGTGDSLLVATTVKEKTVQLLDRLDGKVRENDKGKQAGFVSALDRALQQGKFTREQLAVPGFAFLDVPQLVKAMMSGSHPVDDSLLENPFVAPFESLLIRHSGDPEKLTVDLLGTKKAGSSRNDTLFDAFKECSLPRSAATLPASMSFSLSLSRSVLLPLIENVQAAREVLGVQMDLEWLRPTRGLTLGSRVISDGNNGVEYIAEVDAADPGLLLRGIKDRTRRFAETPPATPIDWSDRELDGVAVSEMRMPFGGGFFAARPEDQVLVFASSDKAMQSAVSELKEAGKKEAQQDEQGNCVKGMIDFVALGSRGASALNMLAPAETTAGESVQRPEIAALKNSLAAQRTFGAFRFAAGAVPDAIVVHATLTPPSNQ